MTHRRSRLADWYATNGRHELAWRHTRDRWAVLVSEVMLQQTQVARVADAWPRFVDRFPTAAAAAAAGPGAVIEAWGRLGYPRRARRLWEATCIITTDGWPADLAELPGVGRYTAAALSALVDGVDAPAVEVNIRRVCERIAGRRLTTTQAEAASLRIGRPLHARERVLALMDLGASVCRSRDPRCRACPLHRRCVARGVLADETRHTQTRFEGSFRQRRGQVLARLRTADTADVAELDPDALASLVTDGLAAIDGSVARLPRLPRPQPL
ncbi:MAG TPA: A/G-specific adenine glycosylase [Acidimicrobiia bacterium]|nr:A/G-specific adenine glycosylase [Acidimicrobiia bacterium]